MTNNKEFDLIVWGASGFTGKLIAEYLFRKYGVNRDLKWAMAGRNEEKLMEVRSEICNETVPIVVANSTDRASLDAMVVRTSVICTTVGPYAIYGSELVASCVENKTDYCDLAGEVQWIRKMIDAHHENAVKNKVKIVHCCGFDSIPSDMGVYFLQNKIKEQQGEFAEEIKFYLKASSGGPSGGTIASLQNIMAEAEKDKSVLKVLEDPYGLNPDNDHGGHDVIDSTDAFYDPDVDAWAGPFLMAAINTKVVRRSHALKGYPYGKEFRYEENLLTGKGLKGKIKAKGVALTGKLTQALKPGSIFNVIVGRFLPDPGEGPSQEQREKGFFNIMLLGKLKDNSVVVGKVTGDRDPGYGSTSKMIAESAVCLVKDQPKLTDIYGCVTPSTAMGEALLVRLQENAGLTFSIKND